MRSRIFWQPISGKILIFDNHNRLYGVVVKYPLSDPEVLVYNPPAVDLIWY